MKVINNMTDTTYALFRVAIDKICDSFNKTCINNTTMVKHDNNNINDHINDFTDLLTPSDYADESTNIRIRKDTNKMSTWSKISGFFGAPTHIVDNIYLGSALNAASKSSLDEHNIKVIINMAKELTDYYPTNYEYYKCNIYDDNNEHVGDFLEKIYTYITEKQWDLLIDKENNDKETFLNNKNVLLYNYNDEDDNSTTFEIHDNYINTMKPTDYKYKGNILIHCYMGASRSAIIAMYYLIKTKGYDIDSAIKYIINKRPHVNPTFRFIKDLAKTIRNK
jgi:protein tyrosine/serine phosphatase